MYSLQYVNRDKNGYRFYWQIIIYINGYKLELVHNEIVSIMQCSEYSYYQYNRVLRGTIPFSLHMLGGVRVFLRKAN